MLAGPGRRAGRDVGHRVQTRHRKRGDASSSAYGTIEELLEWYPVKAGDFFYLPAGTVRAIGPGLTLVEVQQNSDITYRLYDYGRPRELHLDEGIAVASGAPYYPARCRRAVDERAIETLADGPLFRFSQVRGAPDTALRAEHSDALLLLPLEGSVAIEGEAIAAGECGFAERVDAIDFTLAERTLLVSAA